LRDCLLPKIGTVLLCGAALISTPAKSNRNLESGHVLTQNRRYRFGAMRSPDRLMLSENYG
jgi:hypothetical protein